MKNSLPTTIQTAVDFFGKDRVNEFLAGNILDLHKGYSAAYENFKNTEAEAYTALITLRNLMIRKI